jgi:hypothetical protein
MTSTTAPRPTLPVLQTVIDAYLSLRADWGAGQRTFWLSLGLSVGWIWLATSFPGEYQLIGLGWALMGLLLMMVILLGFSSVAVALHRLILLSEQPPARWFSMDEPVLPYLRRVVLIFLIATPIMLLSMQLLIPTLVRMLAPMAVHSFGRFIANWTIWLIVPLPALLVIARLSVALPGIAIGRPMTLIGSWQSTANNTAQLICGIILVQVPGYTIWQASRLAISSPTSALWTELFLAVVNSLVFVAGISFLSLSYRFLVRAPAPGQPEAS